MEILWAIFVVIWVCCVIGWLITMIVPAWRQEMYYMWWYIGILVSNIGILICALFI